jgi:hypothetical protein
MHAISISHDAWGSLDLQRAETDHLMERKRPTASVRRATTWRLPPVSQSMPRRVTKRA